MKKRARLKLGVNVNTDELFAKLTDEEKDWLNNIITLKGTSLRMALEEIEVNEHTTRPIKEIATKALSCPHCDSRRGHTAFCVWAGVQARG